MPPSSHISPCDDIIVLKEKVAALEAWRISTEADLKEIHEIIKPGQAIDDLIHRRRRVIGPYSRATFILVL